MPTDTTELDLPDVPSVSISYEVTRGDIFWGFITIVFRNRILQVFILATIIVSELILIGPDIFWRSWLDVAFRAILFFLAYLVVLTISLTAIGLPLAYIPKQRGLIGRHTLEVTEKGLVESTEFNESLHTWKAVSRIRSEFGYLYIYVSDNHYHQIPKRCFSREELSAFEAEVRRRMAGK